MDMDTPKSVVVDVKPASKSKINWVNFVTLLVGIAASFGIVIPADFQELLLQIVAIAGPLLTIIMRTWFSKTVVAESVK